MIEKKWVVKLEIEVKASQSDELDEVGQDELFEELINNSTKKELRKIILNNIV